MIKPENKTILLWTNWYAKTNWFGTEEGYETGKCASCLVSNCVLTNNRSVVNESHAIMFHMRPGDSTCHLRTASVRIMSLKSCFVHWELQSCPSSLVEFLTRDSHLLIHTSTPWTTNPPNNWPTTSSPWRKIGSCTPITLNGGATSVYRNSRALIGVSCVLCLTMNPFRRKVQIKTSVNDGSTIIPVKITSGRWNSNLFGN